MGTKEMDQLNELATTSLSDAMKGLNSLDEGIKPLAQGMRVAGPATTVKLRAADNKMVLKGILEAKPGDVLVIDAKSYVQNASAGDFVIALAKLVGISGVVIDGSVRDIEGIKDLNYPVFCKGVTTAASDKHGTGEVNVPISCGDAVIQPGDFIVGDENGVVVVPKNDVETVIQKAIEKEDQDKMRVEKVLIDKESAFQFIREQLK